MNTRGKSINLFLIDGDASGRIKCTLANWTGIAYKIPRTELDKCKDRNDLKQSGVYFLFGTSEDDGKNVVYIGQAGVRKNGEGLLNRLQEHKRDSNKDYWTEAVVFTTTNNSFGPTEISYLENKFCFLASNAKRYKVKNGNEPTVGNVTEEKESELEEFIDFAQIIIETLGHKIFVPLINPVGNETKDKSDISECHFYLTRKSRKSGKTIEAVCQQTKEGFVVLKGSSIEIIDSSNIPLGVKEARRNAEIDSDGILQEDILFKSPSYAAGFVVGGHVNGLTEWKTQDAKRLKDIDL
ncbi:MAG: methionine sulfoxide reductase [Epulopiscium sp. Nele67-Bin004]|nr:MAG: methionine sulfoxide reductase [Epulopiscium sp. Nele67-Bin004]